MLRLGHRAEVAADVVEQAVQREVRMPRLQHAGVDLRDVQQLGEQMVQRGHAFAHVADALLPRRVGLVPGQPFREQRQRVQRLAQVVAGGGQQARLGLAGLLDGAVLLGQLGRGLAHALLQQLPAVVQGGGGGVEALLQMAHFRGALQRHLHRLAGGQPVDGIGQLEHRRADAARRPHAGQQHGRQARRHRQQHAGPGACLGGAQLVQADVDADLPRHAAARAGHRRAHQQALLAPQVGGVDVGQQFPFGRPHLHLLHMRLRHGGLGQPQQRAPVLARQRRLRRGRQLLRQRFPLLADVVLDALQVLPRGQHQQRPHRQHRRHHGQQHQLPHQRQPCPPMRWCRYPVHGM